MQKSLQNILTFFAIFIAISLVIVFSIPYDTPISASLSCPSNFSNKELRFTNMDACAAAMEKHTECSPCAPIYGWRHYTELIIVMMVGFFAMHFLNANSWIKLITLISSVVLFSGCTFYFLAEIGEIEGIAQPYIPLAIFMLVGLSVSGYLVAIFLQILWRAVRAISVA